MAEYLRLFGQNQEGLGAACHVLCLQVGCGLFVQGTFAPEEKVDGMKTLKLNNF